MSASKELLEKIKKRHKATTAQLLSGGAMSDVKHVIPTGIDVLDRYILGIGGFPCGRITELFGPEGCGKSSLVFQLIAQAQKLSYPVVFVETEQAIETGRIHEFDVDLDEVILNQPGHLEEVMEFMETVLDSIDDNTPFLLAWDSIAETPSKREVEEGLTGKDKVGDRAKSLSKLCRVMKRRVAQKQAACIFVNQIRDRPGVMFGDTTTTPGGHAVKFASSVRLSFMGGAAVKDGDKHVGKKPTILTPKNKFAPPWRKAKVRLDYGDGWNDDWTTVNFAKDEKKIDSGKRFSKKLANEARKALGW